MKYVLYNEGLEDMKTNWAEMNETLKELYKDIYYPGRNDLCGNLFERLGFPFSDYLANNMQCYLCPWANICRKKILADKRDEIKDTIMEAFRVSISKDDFLHILKYRLDDNDILEYKKILKEDAELR